MTMTNYIVTNIEFDGEMNETELRNITEIAFGRIWNPSESYLEMEDDVDEYDLEYDIANQISDETGWCINHLEIVPLTKLFKEPQTINS